MQSVPLYVSEMAPPKYRGAFNNLFQLSITIGIFIANLVNFGTAKLQGSTGWRVSLGLAAVPAIIMVLCAFKRVRGVDTDAEIEAEFSDMVAASEASKQVVAPWRNLFKRKNSIL